MEQKKPHQIAKRPLYREEIKEALMQAITSGDLAPGDRIVESRWARDLGVSQSPIREAIRELEMIGLVENIPYKGTIVRKLTRKDIIDTYEVRIALETMEILRNCCISCGNAWNRWWRVRKKVTSPGLWKATARFMKRICVHQKMTCSSACGNNVIFGITQG